MNCRWIGDIKEFCKIKNDWDMALGKSGEDNPFLLSDFIITWWKHYSKKRRLAIFVAYDEEELIAGIPLCIEKKLTRNIMVHVGGQAANLTHFFSTNKKIDIASAFMDLLMKRDDWHSFILTRAMPHMLFLEQLDGLNRKYCGNIEFSIVDDGINGMIDLREGYEKVMLNLNNRLRRYLRSGKEEAGKLGELKLCRIKGKQAVRELFTEYKKFSIASFKARNDRSAFEDDVYSAFFGDVLDVFESKDMLDAHKIVAGHNVLGISFGYRFGAGFKWILTTYNPGFQNLRPGHLLLDFLVQEAILRGDDYFDMYYGGEMFYKRQWCNKTVPLKRIEIYRKTLFNVLAISAEKRIRSNGPLLAALKKTRDMFYGLRV